MNNALNASLSITSAVYYFRGIAVTDWTDFHLRGANPIAMPLGPRI